MRLVFIGLLLLPLAVLAQIDFDPVRLDDGQGRDYYYPQMQVDGSNLLCTWSSVSDEQIVTHGRHTTPSGELLDQQVYQVIPAGGEIWCPANMSLFQAPDGSRPFLIYHS
jgi:hypothetical protein